MGKTLIKVTRLLTGVKYYNRDTINNIYSKSYRCHIYHNYNRNNSNFFPCFALYIFGLFVNSQIKY